MSARTTAASIAIEWQTSDTPLVAEAVLARGEVAKRLAMRVLANDDATLAKLRGVAADGLLVIAGATDDLPWIDGVMYLGRSNDAPQLYLPTTRVPRLGAAMLARAVVRRARELDPPFALIDDPPLIVSLSARAAIDRSRLEAWLEAQ